MLRRRILYPLLLVFFSFFTVAVVFFFLVLGILVLLLLVYTRARWYLALKNRDRRPLPEYMRLVCAYRQGVLMTVIVKVFFSKWNEKKKGEN